MQALLAYTFPVTGLQQISDELMERIITLASVSFGVPDTSERSFADALRGPGLLPLEYELAILQSDADPNMCFPIVPSGQSVSLESDWFSSRSFVDVKSQMAGLKKADKLFMNRLSSLFGTSAQWMMIRADNPAMSISSMVNRWDALASGGEA